MQESYLDSKVNRGTRTQTTKTYCILWHSECLIQCKASYLFILGQNT